MTNPYLINAMQQPQGQPVNQPTQQQRPQQQQQALSMPQPQERYNVFSNGIRAAIESARASMEMTRPQQDNALRKGMLAFADNLGQQPKERGFANNLGTAMRALSPGLQAYGNAEAAAQTENQAMAEKLAAHEAQEQMRTAQEEDRAWNRDFHERQFDEQQQNNSLMNRFRQNSLDTHETKYEHEGKKEIEAKQDLWKTLDIADREITTLGNEASRGRGGRLLDKFLPGGNPLNEAQASINAIGDILRGKLFNAWGYRNQAEFEHVPSISADNPPEVNQAIIKKMKQILYSSEQMESAEMQDTIEEDIPAQEPMLIMMSNDGQSYQVPASKREIFEQNGYQTIE